MRIPIYNAEASVTREAPGRSIRARMDATPFINAELRKGEVLQSAAQAAGEYANARYKVQVENDLNEAMLGAQETLRTRRDELAKSPDYNRVLDGDNPIWSQETSQIKNELRKKVGKNRYALSQFDNRFGQLELQNRFALRNDIDRKVASVAAANRAQQLIDGENTIATSPNLADIDFTIAGVKLNGDRLVKLGLGKGENLSKQEYAMVFRGTQRALNNLVNSSDSSVLTVHEIHKALRDESTDAPEGEGVSPEGQKVYHLLRSLNEADQAKLLKSAGATSTYIDGPTIFEKNQQLITKEIGKQAEGTLNQYIDNTEKGFIPSDADVQALQVQLDAARQSQTPAEYADLAAKVEYFNTVKVAAAEMKRMNGRDLREAIADRENVENPSQTQIDVLQFMRGRLNALDTAVENDPLPWANTNGVVTLNDVDYADFANETFAAKLQERIGQSLKVQGVYERGDLNLAPVIMTKAETAQVSRMLNEMRPEEDLAFFSSVNLALGEDASILFDQLGDDNGFMSMLGTLNITNSDAARQIAIGLQMGKDVPGNKISIKSLVGGNETELSFLKIKQQIFTGVDFENRGNTDAIVHRAVEAMLTYQTQTGELSTDFAELNQEQFRAIVSFALGGSKDGETGGVGQLGDEDNPRYYFRPDGVSDDDFKLGLESLQALHPLATSIQSILDSKNFTVSMVGNTKSGEHVYSLVLEDSDDPMDMGVTQFAAFKVSKKPVLFTFSDLVKQAKSDDQAKLKKSDIAKSSERGTLVGNTTQAEVNAYNDALPTDKLGIGLVDNSGAVAEMLAPQTDQAAAETAKARAEIAETAKVQAEINKLLNGPVDGENFQAFKTATAEAEAQDKLKNAPKEYTIAVYGNQKTQLKYTMDADGRIFDSQGKEVVPDDNRKLHTDILMRINRQALEDIGSSKSEVVPETAEETLSEDPEINDEEFNQVIDGNKYKGEMKNGKKHGAGVLIRKDGAIAEGNFKNNFFDGGVVIRKPSGEMIVRGNFKKGRLIDDEDVVISPDILKIAQEFFDSSYDSNRRVIDLNKARITNQLRENYLSDLGWVVSNEELKILLDRLDLK